IRDRGSPDSTMSAKVENDAVAYIRSIATEQGRNADWAEQVVRQSVSVEAEEALRLGVIDRISPDLRSLLVAIDGTVVETAAGPETLRTGDLPVRERKKSVADRILGVISDPNIAYLLFLAGILGIFFELSNPGAVLPGIIGGISIILALFAFQTLSVNFAGVLLILLALILFIAEVKVASSGALAIGGALSLLLGSLMLFRRAGGGLGVSLKTIIPAVVITTGLFFFAIVMAWRAQRRRPQTGTEGMIGELATVVEDLRLEGRVFLHGEIWTAVATTPVPKGGKVRVLAVEGLRLRVESIEGGTPAREV
ncbi:MAG: NfeD family protein, partial [Candidatus Eisenbacteria bacterium]|nr:NfeD family protein [Candidatus Eisenbacteria bacterium]